MPETARISRGDVALAVALAVVVSFGTVFTLRTAEGSGPDVLPVALVLIAPISLVLRRRRPFLVLAVCAVTTSTHLLLGHPPGPVLLAVAVAVYSVATLSPTTTATIAAALAAAVLLPHTVLEDSLWPGLGFALAWAAVPCSIGIAVRVTRLQQAAARRQELRRHADEERLRLAQDVHDVVGHGLAAIKMQADVALHVLSRSPEQAESALHRISGTAAEALEEVRGTLRSVREDEGSEELAPRPLAVDDLVERMAAAGLQVEATGQGLREPLPPEVRSVGHRVLREALTNALRHGADGTAHVASTRTAGQLEITVTNPCRDRPPEDPFGAAGMGLRSMQDRVRALGGEFQAGVTESEEAPERVEHASRQFRVRATIPVEEPR
ncbi:sensor histidine kinase [Nesterenkonia halobia]|uniref:histidine kinase n=1 Tax=Nesterenkonia halobia TaxID=37922 RepID=A0ABP6R615_9MICC